MLYMLLNGGLLGKLIVLLILVAAGYLVFQIRPVRRAILFAIKLLPAGILWLVGIIAIPLWKPIGGLVNIVLNAVPLDRMFMGLLLGRHGRDRTTLAKMRENIAHRMWPPETHPELYQPVPEDLYRPPYEDGRLLGGHPVSWLADRHMTEQAVASAVRTGLKAGILFFLLAGVLLLLWTVLSVVDFFPALLRGDRPVIEQWPGEEPIRASAWSMIGANIGHATTHLLENLAALVVYIPADAVISAGVAIFITLALLRTWMQTKGSPYELVSKDAEVRWPYRIETRHLLRRTYRNQLKHHAKRLADQPLFRVGAATGTLRVRGDLAAPLADQAVQLDSESLFQHTLVLGGTGEGKTTAVLKPLLRQVLAHRHFGMFLADAKGVLHSDAARIAEQLGRSEDVLVVGTGPDQLGVDVTAGLNPAQIAAALRSVLTQTGGQSSESFWPEMASTVVRHELTIGRGYAQTDAGKAEIEQGLHPYSLWWAYQAILRPELSENAIEHINATHALYDEKIDAAETADQVRHLRREAQTLMTSELRDSIAYIQSAWRDMATETKTGIIANVTNLMDGFGSSAVLRERFASGRSEGALNLRAALDGKLVLVALSSVEDGLPARLVTILLKTSLYREARRREAELKRQGIDPQTRPCLVVMDEVQEIVTVDPTSGLSDGTFWNVARSTGLAGLFATQTLAALKQSMGEHAADNFMQQARSKIFFRSEERGTVEYACWAAGEFERNRVYEANQRESLEYRLLIDEWDPLHPIDESEQLTGGPRTFFDAARALLNPDRAAVGQSQGRAAYSADLRFIATDAPESGNASSMGSQQAAYWRAEDLNRAYREQGNDLRPALAISDLTHMGRWHAFAQIQRAGAVRQDIIVVEPDYT